MRVFIAITLTDEIRERMERVRICWQDKITGVKWVPRENLHLTLKFLGEIDRKTLNATAIALRETCASFQSFKISFRGMGVFPHPKQPKVLWCGIEANRCLTELVGAVNSLFNFGGDSKPFRPHITIGRVKNTNSEIFHLIQETDNIFPDGWGIMQVDGIDIMESILQPTGPIYKKIQTIKLK